MYRASQSKSKVGRCRICGKVHHSSVHQDESKREAVFSASSPVVLLKVNGVKCRAQLDTGASFIGEMASFRTAHIAVY